MAEKLLQAHASLRNLDVVASSAGIRSVDLPVDPDAEQAMAELGHDISTHKPRMITNEILSAEPPDLVLTMSRMELRHVVTLDRNLWGRTFTLKEFVRRGTDNPRDSALSFAGWTAELCIDRRAADLMTDSPEDDIPDPYGTGLSTMRSIAHVLNSLTSAAIELLPKGRPGGKNSKVDQPWSATGNEH